MRCMKQRWKIRFTIKLSFRVFILKKFFLKDGIHLHNIALLLSEKNIKEEVN